ncbi:MAG: ATP-dependent DNA helicase RecG [Pseudomonadota bacterium]
MSGRPEALFPLFVPMESLPGIGPVLARNFAGLYVNLPRDLLFVLPGSAIDRRLQVTIADMALPDTITVEVLIGSHRPPRQKGGAYRVHVSDAQAEFQLVFFHARGDYWRKTLPEGSRRVVSGRVEVFDGLAQMVHPDHILKPDALGDLPGFEPVYPLTAGITQKTMLKATSGALDRLPKTDEWIDPALCRDKDWPDFATALHRAHRPPDSASVALDAPARLRLAYDELFAHQVTLALARARESRKPGRASVGDGRLQKQVRAQLPFVPTGAQDRAIEQISKDLAAPNRMNRLLQGDVGAGKTLIAVMALLRVVEAGGQGVLMAPTEILAHQHLESIEPLILSADVCVKVLTGRDRGETRAKKLAALANGEIDILIGTHAVFQSDVVFQDLRLAVIDEQHRFGVRQRLALGQKGLTVDVLVMTATPIPRSLTLAHYGDLDISILDEKPPGRQPVQTVVVSADRAAEVIARLSAALAAGRQCYWVCPLVEESEVTDLAAAEARFKVLRAALGESAVGLVHGQMPPDHKDAAMKDFVAGITRVLVATTVIEVGVDVPNASIMVIERAETFGLAQLHQLRGRVGRGQAASTCLLIYQAPLTETARQRLEILRQTEDGFEIAETDLRIRGAGDVIGTAQSGLPRFRIANLERHAELMKVAQRDARALLSLDPDLTSARGKATRLLLWLTGQEKAIGLISVG